MNRKNQKTNIKLLIILLLIGLHQSVAQDSLIYYQQPVVVTANRTPTNVLYVSRSIDIIDSGMVHRLGTVSIEDALRSGSNITVQSRGLFGIQTDVSIRGSLFSQNLILINGVPLSDPQTSHHNLDIPISTMQIDRIEVLKGPGSAQYGANAYGGIVNIIIQEPKETSGTIRLSGGNFGLFEGIGSFNVVSSHIQSSHTVEFRRSDGYRYDTDFSIASFTTNTIFNLPFGSYSLLGGYSKKSFGAFDFYSPGKNKPSKEWTETALLNLSTPLDFSSIRLTPRIYYRRHYDKFMYDLRIPDRFVNEHFTNVIGSEVIGLFNLSDNISIVSGLEANVNTIASTALGDHSQSLIGMYFSSHFVAENNVTIDAGVRSDFHSAYETQFNPTVGLGYIFFQRGKVYSTIGRSFRNPNFTELYYSDPSTKGNSHLQPEVGWSYEVGIDYIFGMNWHSSLSVFEHDQTNLIDYVQYFQSDTLSYAVNFTSARTRGFELNLRWQETTKGSGDVTNLTLQRFMLAYGYLNSYIDRGNVYSSRYAFTHPKHQISINLIASLPYIISISIDLVHKIKQTKISNTLLDARLSKDLFSTSLFIRGTNLLNQSYEEIIGVPLPGRWIWMGIEYKLF